MKAEFYYSQRRYECSVISLCVEQENIKELRIRNHEGEILAIRQGQKTALRGKTRATSQEVDILKSNYYNLIKAAVMALEIQDKQKLIKDKDEQIQLLNAEIEIFREKANLSDSERDEIVQLRDRIQVLSDQPNTSPFSYDMNDQKISTSDRQLVNQFLAEWEHPLSRWLLDNKKAASKIDQIAKLRNLTAHPMPIYKWQFTELWLLVIGGKTKSGRVQKGLLKEVYDKTNLASQ